jgi:phospholipid/cholesterol/gamma-HCH transport system ATP-binding protein
MRAGDSEAVIEVQGLTAAYGDRQVLAGVDLTVRHGEIMVIMGGSGSGKSTLLRHLLGLMRATDGRVEVLGHELGVVSRKNLYELRRQIGVAFQGGALLNSMTLIENVELPLRQHTSLDDTTIGIMSRMKLEMMSLSGFEHLMPSELSGGMLKRASLARAVVMDPKLLFFDEPSAGLDPITSAELDELILRLRSAMKMTIVVVTHELHSALQIADRISILGEGKVLMVGTVDEIRASEDDYIQSLLNRRPRKEELDVDDYLRRLTRTQ